MLIVIVLVSMPIFASMISLELAIEDRNDPLPRTSDITLIDKVYSFSPGQGWKLLEGLPFKAHYTYYVYFKIVTPHECNLTITLIDPEGSIYDAYYDDYFSQGDGMRYFPFGAALGGSHDILFELDLDYTLNMHVKVEESVKCLHDVFSWQDAQNIKQYGVAKFEQSLPLIKNVVLEADAAYTLYFARVSPITGAISHIIVCYEYSMMDVDQALLFDVNWRHDPLKPIGEVSLYSFGTARGGPYMSNLTIHYDENPVNIAFAIIFDHDISGGIDENNTTEDGREASTLKFTIPLELSTLTLIAIGAATFIAIGVVATRRRGSNSP